MYQDISTGTGTFFSVCIVDPTVYDIGLTSAQKYQQQGLHVTNFSTIGPPKIYLTVPLNQIFSPAASKIFIPAVNMIFSRVDKQIFQKVPLTNLTSLESSSRFKSIVRKKTKNYP